MNRPIVEGLLKYKNKKMVRFHMPGHKGKSVYELSKFIPSIDITEVEGADNLHNPKGIIEKSEKKASNIYGTKRTFYSVNGTTAGIYAAITASVKPGEEILIQRNCHKSIYNSLVIGKIKAHYIYPEYDNDKNILTTIDPNEIDKILNENKKIKAVVITYPTYFGICSDIKMISDIVHKHGRVLIVDEAHGAHLKFSEHLPISAEEAGADIVVQSTHKTLPAYTQSSMVHLNSNRINEDKLAKMMSMYQTTSPSYILMASLDIAIDYMGDKGVEKLENINLIVGKFIENVKKIEGIDIITKGEEYDFDNTKIVINATKLGLHGSDLEDVLREKYKIEMEMSDLYHALAMVSVMNTKGDLDKLHLALKDISKTYADKEIKNEKNIKYLYPEKQIEIYEAFNEDSQIVNLDDALDEISADYIIPYPPGVPILLPGEILSSDIIDYIKQVIYADIEILGIKENKISIIKK